jgi:hypothetical protein
VRCCVCEQEVAPQRRLTCSRACSLERKRRLRREAARRCYLRNKDAIRERVRLAYLANPLPKLARHQRWAEKNREWLRLRSLADKKRVREERMAVELASLMSIAEGAGYVESV